MVTKKEQRDPPPTPSPSSLSALCYCLFVSQLITTPLDQVGWLTMRKRHDTDLPEGLDTQAIQGATTQTTHQHKVQTHTHVHNQEIETKINPPVVTTCCMFQGRFSSNKEDVMQQWDKNKLSAWDERRELWRNRWGPRHNHTSPYLQTDTFCI